jgi:hypothetical protein
MMLHRIANSITEEAAENSCTVIAFEETTGIRDRLPAASWGHECAFERLYEYVEYEAELRGITLEGWTRRTRRGGVRHVGSPTETTATARRSTLSSAATRTVPTTTLGRTSDYGLSAVTRPGTAEAHPYACA